MEFLFGNHGRQVRYLSPFCERSVAQLSLFRTLKGLKPRDSAILMKHAPKDEKVAYFYWQGRHAAKIDLGTSALKVVDLDLEGGKQIRVVQHEESAAFLRLFGGHFTVESSMAARNHKGRI